MPTFKFYDVKIESREKLEKMVNFPKLKKNGEFHCGTGETNPTRNCEVVGSIPGLAQQVNDLALP